MRRLLIGALTGLLLQVPHVAGAQTPVDVARIPASDWQQSGAPLMFGGSFYYPSGPPVFFDGSVMARSGSFEGVPIYIDATRGSSSVVYVPVAGGLMRPYERSRADQAADGLAKPPASAPVESDRTASSVAVRSSVAVGSTAPLTTAGPPVRSPDGAALQSMTHPHPNRGIWIEFAGRVWLASGGAGAYWPGRFAQVGTYHGFPVYQESGHRDQIFVPSVPGGPVARYSLSNERAADPSD